MSSLKDSEEQTSPPMTEGSLGVQVASSHFSKINARSGNSGCLKGTKILFHLSALLINYRCFILGPLTESIFEATL